MANEEHLNILRQGVPAWNKWKKEHPDIVADLSGTDRSGAYLIEADLTNANLSRAILNEASLGYASLSGANLSRATLYAANLSRTNLTSANLSEAFLHTANLLWADLRGANLMETNLMEANLCGAILSRANLSGANLSRANLSGTDLTEADLNGADLSQATLVETNLTRADLTRCHIFGISAWELALEETIQTDLIITKSSEPLITVDNLEVAQFIYLVLHNEKIREVIDTIGKKAVLILGRFTPERLVVLDALRAELRRRNYMPILFDFEKPNSRDLTETVVTLAHMSRFIIADITDAKSIPQELQAIVPNLPSVAVQPIILSTQYEYAMFEHFKHYHWVLPVYQYDTQELLLATLLDNVIQPAEEKVKELRAIS